MFFDPGVCEKVLRAFSQHGCLAEPVTLLTKSRWQLRKHEHDCDVQAVPNCEMFVLSSLIGRLVLLNPLFLTIDGNTVSSTSSDFVSGFGG